MGLRKSIFGAFHRATSITYKTINEMDSAELFAIIKVKSRVCLVVGEREFGGNFGYLYTHVDREILSIFSSFLIFLLRCMSLLGNYNIFTKAARRRLFSQFPPLVVTRRLSSPFSFSFSTVFSKKHTNTTSYVIPVRSRSQNFCTESHTMNFCKGL